MFHVVSYVCYNLSMISSLNLSKNKVGQLPALLIKSLEAGQIGHAYLFVGSEYIDKLVIAKQFTGALKCDSLDFILIEPEIIETKGVKKQSNIGIDQIKNIQYWASLSPYNSPRKVAVINNADKMTDEAANSLLKTLEESPPKTIFILITSSVNSLLPTIISRCQIIKFPLASFKHFTSEDFLKEYETAAQDLVSLINSDLAVKYKYAEDMAKDVGAAREKLKLWLFVFRDAVLNYLDCRNYVLKQNLLFKNYSVKKLMVIIKQIGQTSGLIANSSINARLALEVLMLEF